MESSHTPETSVDTAILRKAGLTESQAKGYLALIEHGELTPVELAEKAGESRTNGYMICEKLEQLGLATKKDGPKAVYKPGAPAQLKRLVIEQQRRLKNASEELNGLIPSLTTRFHLNSDDASVLTLEGIAGVRTLYSDILRSGHSLSIIPSQYDRVEPDISAEIDQQIQKQIEKGITTRALYPHLTPDEAVELDRHNIQVRACGLDAPAQIIIYGHTVAISTFRQGMITSVISHPDIAETFQAVFDLLWDKAASITN